MIALGYGVKSLPTDLPDVRLVLHLLIFGNSEYINLAASPQPVVSDNFEP